ncbi:CRISPR-associated protein Csx19 [Solwaraspora sp. WMMD792]|uniref:type III-D CRISPR-associated protein Csx19 n=1 Tax=Solwaraspora sp. WMMD792 TaxID=3016099 RepID=UPI002416E032|nr:CRISPR-associated protein Csx19 [Solwaraspora sp. WMMD792]MDG4771533.1 CRISPR-associated protein Csx19 [Solwaraspora sp. WMMD792]
MREIALGATLHAVRAATPLTAADAVSWFTARPAGAGQTLGYTFSAGAATWLSIGPDGAVEHVSDADNVLAEAYELLLFDGERELRWLREPDGRGTAVALGEDPADLPPGRPVTAEPAPRRGDTHRRLLAGTPQQHPRAGWTSLASDRYAAAHLPVTAVGARALTVETVEYLVEDIHGNLDVADVRTVALRATVADTGAAREPERTTA